MYNRIYHVTETRTLNYYMIDPSSRWGGRPTTNKNRNSLDYNQNLVMSPGEARRQDGLNVSCKVILTDSGS